MDDLLVKQAVKVLTVGDVVDGIIISASKNEIWVNLGPHGTGLVMRREIDHTDKLKPGDSVSVSIVEPEDDEGYAILSLKKVAKEKGWDYLEKSFAEGEIVTVRPFDANKGGLLVEVEGVRGFLPVSQLSAENYPRVAGADKEEILNRLMGLINKPLEVRVLDLSRKDNKLILSEKEAYREETESRVANLKVGDEVKGVVTGVVDFGIFVNVKGVEGLVHISEIAWDRVDHPSKYVKVGQTIEAKIIAIDHDKLSLSMKQLQDDPWAEEISQLKVGQTVRGKITRITPFGAFVRISPAVEALVHVAELSHKTVKHPLELIKVGEEKTFKIITIDAAAHKLSLSLKGLPTKDSKTAAKKIAVKKITVTKEPAKTKLKKIVNSKKITTKSVTKTTKTTKDK